MKYATEMSPPPDFVLKTDDDTFIRMDRILRELPTLRKDCLFW
jgi:hypothetical protein